MTKAERIIQQNYNNRTKNECEHRSYDQSIIVPKGNETVNLLPISNVFMGSKKSPPRLEMLVEDIKKINDDPNGAFFLGGNLFYYPSGNTEQKSAKVEKIAEDLAVVLDSMNKKKVLLAYDGVNEESLRNDRILKWPIQSTKTLCEYLGISNRYFAGPKVEMDFVFNNELTNHKNQIMNGIFTSMRPISVSKQAIVSKFYKRTTLNGGKTFAIDTSSSLELQIHKLNIEQLDKLRTAYYDSYIISPAGYTDQPQRLTKDTNYNINTKVIQLKVTPQINELLPENTRNTDTTIYQPYKKMANLLTIGVDHDKFLDDAIVDKLNETIFLNELYKEAIVLELEKQFNKDRDLQLDKTLNKEITKKKSVAKPNNNNEAEYRFE